MKTRFERKLIDQGFADTRAPSLDKALTDLHSAICKLDGFNLRLLREYYPEAIPLARRFVEIYPTDNQLKDPNYYGR
tara:strand:+ start:1284 stop:1514 length:231 start_codon:yes stop_codon:yes gene_type:complete